MILTLVLKNLLNVSLECVIAGDSQEALQPDFTSSDSTQIFTFVLIVPISLNNTTVDAD